MSHVQIPPIISLNRKLTEGGQKGSSADAKGNMTPPDEVDRGNGKELPVSAEHKQVDTIIEIVKNQVSSNCNNAEKLLIEELLANDSPGG